MITSKTAFHRLSLEPWRSIFYLVSLTIARGIIQIRLYQQGFISASADEFARGIINSAWAQNPRLNLLEDIQGTWLPLEKYVNGLFLLIWPDVILAPRLTVFVFSTLLLIVLYVLAQELFERFSIAVMTTLLVASLPWFVWLSGTPMLEMYYFTCFFAGLLFLAKWLKNPHTNVWIISGGCFVLASGFHVQSWTFINLINLLLLPYLYWLIKNKKYQFAYKIIAFYVLSNGFIITFALIEFFYTGQVLQFFQSHTFYSRWYYAGYDVSIREKLLYYPSLVYRNTDIIFNTLAILGIFLLGYQSQIKWKISLLLLGAVALLFNSIMNIFSGPPSAAPDRYSLFYMIILAFYVALAIDIFGRWGLKQEIAWRKYSTLILILGLIGSHLLWQSQKISNYPQGMAVDSVNVGRQLSHLLQENDVYMVELRYWDFLAIRLLAGPHHQSIYDREFNLYNRQTISIFTQDKATICSQLQIPDLQYLVLQDVALKTEVQQIDNFVPLQEVGRWTIYELDLDFICN